jgi:type I restriction enzyme S subunit
MLTQKEILRNLYLSESNKILLGNLCEITIGRTPRREVLDNFGGNHIWVSIADMKGKFVEDSKEKLTDKGVKDGKSRLIPEGTLLLSYKLSVGKVAITKKPLYTNEAIAALIPKKPINIGYLYYYLKQIDFAKYGRKAVKGICLNKEILSKIEILLIPTEEQIKIVTLLEKVEQLHKWRKESDKLTNDYLNSVFLKIFGDPVKNPRNWIVKKLNQVCTRITDGTHGSPPNVDTGDFLYITAKNITKDGVSLDNVTYVSTKNHEEIYRRCNPVRGDVLYIKDGATTGIAQVNKFDFQFSLLSSVALLKPSKELNSDYLAYLLNSESMYKKLRSEMAGVAITRLTITKIKSFVIPVPPIKLQEDFSKIVSIMEEIKGDQKESKQQINDLQNCLMQELFKGAIS